MTPVVYPVSLLPPGAKLLVAWQPLFALFASYQAVFSGGVPNALLILQAMVLGRRAARSSVGISSFDTNESSRCTSNGSVVPR